MKQKQNINKLPALGKEGCPKDGVVGQNDFIPTSMFLGTKGLAKAIAACTNKQELQQLYTDNKERIDVIPELKEVFMKKKKEMRKRVEFLILICGDIS